MHKTTHSSYEFIHFLIIENSAMGGEIIGVIQKAIMIKIVGIRLPIPVNVISYSMIILFYALLFSIHF